MLNAPSLLLACLVSSGWVAESFDVEVDERSIVIDVFERDSGACVWHGSARTGHRAHELSPQDFREALRSLLSQLPSAR